MKMPITHVLTVALNPPWPGPRVMVQHVRTPALARVAVAHQRSQSCVPQRAAWLRHTHPTLIPPLIFLPTAAGTWAPLLQAVRRRHCPTRVALTRGKTRCAVLAAKRLCARVPYGSRGGSSATDLGGMHAGRTIRETQPLVAAWLLPQSVAGSPPRFSPLAALQRQHDSTVQAWDCWHTSTAQRAWVSARAHTNLLRAPQLLHQQLAFSSSTFLLG